MRNAVLLTVELAESNKPLTQKPLVATFTVTASHKNTADMTITDDKTGEAQVAPGAQYRFERVDLATLLVRGKAGETAFVIGHTA